MNLPASPTADQIVTLGTKSFQWNATLSVWKSYAVPNEGGGGGGSNTTIDDVAPTSPVYGDRWIKPSTGVESVWVPNEGSDGVWWAPVNIDTSAFAASSMTYRVTTVNAILVAADANNAVEFNSSSDRTFTIPLDLAAYVVGQSTLLINSGTGLVTIVLPSGVTGAYKSDLTLVLNGQNAQVAITKKAGNVYTIVGDLDPV